MEVKGGVGEGETSHANIKKKKVDVTVYYQTKQISRQRILAKIIRDLIIIKEPLHQEDLTTLNMAVLNNRAPSTN